jgi:hypothetical protein
MLEELRYQAKTQALSDMPRKENRISCIFSPFFLNMLYGNDIIQQACKA